MGDHNEWLKRGFGDGVFVVTGTLQPKAGCAILALVPARSDLEARLSASPFVSEGVVRPRSFLEAHANASGIFFRVAAPMLVDALRAEGEALVAHKFAEIVGDFRSGIVRDAGEDPLFTDLEKDPRVTALQRKPSKPGGQPRPLPLRRYRFGEVLYREYRCGWAHNLRGSNRLAPSNTNQSMGWGDQDATVRYQNYTKLREGENGSVVQIKLRRPVLSTEWLFGIYEQGIDSFEKQCRADRKDPMPYIPLD